MSWSIDILLSIILYNINNPTVVTVCTSLPYTYFLYLLMRPSKHSTNPNNYIIPTTTINSYTNPFHKHTTQNPITFINRWDVLPSINTIRLSYFICTIHRGDCWGAYGPHANHTHSNTITHYIMKQYTTTHPCIRSTIRTIHIYISTLASPPPTQPISTPSHARVFSVWRWMGTSATNTMQLIHYSHDWSLWVSRRIGWFYVAADGTGMVSGWVVGIVSSSEIIVRFLGEIVWFCLATIMEFINSLLL